MSINEFCREAAEGSGSMREKVRRMRINDFRNSITVCLIIERSTNLRRATGL